jgi:hypothetical protein
MICLHAACQVKASLTHSILSGTESKQCPANNCNDGQFPLHIICDKLLHLSQLNSHADPESLHEKGNENHTPMNNSKQGADDDKQKLDK